MMTVADQHSPWLIPSRMFAARIHDQDSAPINTKGTGMPTSQPVTSTFFLPMRSASLPANKLLIAFASPNVMRKETIAACDVMSNSRSPMRGRTDRSIPTIAPTNALIRTRRENCGRLGRIPSRGFFAFISKDDAWRVAATMVSRGNRGRIS